MRILIRYIRWENLYQYYKSRENPYQVLQVTSATSECAIEIEGLYDNTVITIVPSYTGKYDSLVTINVVTHAAHW